MNRTQLTQDQLTGLANKLLSNMEITSTHSDAGQVIVTGNVHSRCVAIFWDIIDGVHLLQSVVTTKRTFTVA